MDWLSKQDMISILLTFGMGFVAGVYLYIVGFGAFMAQIAVPDQERASEFVIIADMYGGCRSDCPSFQVQSDGEYRYLYVPQVGQETVLRQGTLPLTLQRELRSVVTGRALRQQSVVVEPEACNSFVDGVDVAYDITLGGEEYVIDSCGTAVVGDSELWLALNRIWEYFDSL